MKSHGWVFQSLSCKLTYHDSIIVTPNCPLKQKGYASLFLFTITDVNNSGEFKVKSRLTQIPHKDEVSYRTAAEIAIHEISRKSICVYSQEK